MTASPCKASHVTGVLSPALAAITDVACHSRVITRNTAAAGPCGITMPQAGRGLGASSVM